MSPMVAGNGPNTSIGSFIFSPSISVVCASRESVRDLMLGVEETGMLDTGQYVFINIGKYLSHST